MTRFFVFVSLSLSLFLAVQTFADDDFSEIDVCKDFSEIARDIMIARQKDKPMSETLPIARDRIKKWADKWGFPLDIEGAEDRAAQLVMEAYDQPSWGTGGNAQREISNYENRYFSECYKGLTSESDSRQVPNQLPSETKMWAVQLGSFVDKEDAEILAADLRKQGYAAFLSQLTTDSGQLYRVRVGPQRDRESAGVMASRLAQVGLKGQVVPHP